MTVLPSTALLAALLACAPAARAQEDATETRLGTLGSALAHGDWNDRMHAVQELAPLQTDALPLLRFAADDADWQVRLAAVHQLGLLGQTALPALAEVLQQEPCRHVRISAIHWLGRMGEPAAPVLERALDDESRMLRLEDRYWLDKMGRAPAQSRDDARTETSIAEDEDLNVCAGSPEPGRLGGDRSLGGDRKSSGAATIPAETSAAVSPDVAGPVAISSTAVPSDAGDPYLQSLADVRKVAERAPAAGPAGAAAVADDGPPIPPSRPPETLPPGPPVAAREERSSEAELLALAARAKPDPTLAAPGPRLARQTLPPGAAGLAPREEPRPAARFEADAGAPKPETDPVPALLAQLRSPDARARARAADELGKRGAAQVGVLAALRRALRDRVARVRAGAALALGNLGAGEAVADLARAARDKDEDVRWSATVALGRIKTPAARATFRRLVLRASS